MMNALEFSTKIEHGVIKLPKQYEDYDSAYARVIILVDRPLPIEEVSTKEKLRQAFKKMEGVAMFKQIENPTNWQKQQRDDWE